MMSRRSLTLAGVALAVVVTLLGAVGVAALEARATIEIPAPVSLNEDAVQQEMDAQSSRFMAQEAEAATTEQVHDEDEEAALDASDSEEEEEEEDADMEFESEEEGEEAEGEEEGEHPSDSLLQIKNAASAAERAARRPRGIGHIALPRKDGSMTRVDYARKLWRERIRRRLKAGGMMRRYAPELFGQDIYGVDENDNVKLGSRATMWDAMNGPFAPLPKPSKMRAPVNPDAVKFAMLKDAQAHAKLDKKQGLRHAEYYLKNDPYRNAYTYVARNHRNPFGFARIVARARADQALDISPFDGPRFRHTQANPTLAFSKGAQRNSAFPMPSNPRLPFAEADAAIAGMRPSKLQQFETFQPPPAIPKMAAAPPQGGADAPTNGDTPE